MPQIDWISATEQPPGLSVLVALKNRVPLYEGQTASRRSVQNRGVRDLHYAALFF
jgi:hypothetical protein